MTEHGQPIALEALNIGKTFRQGPKDVHVLHDVSLQLHAGRSLAIVGASGAGKSTLLHILGGLDEPDHGEVLVEGQALWQLSAAARGQMRNLTMGFIYQFHHLLPEFTAVENVAMPLLIRGNKAANAAARVLASYSWVAMVSDTTLMSMPLKGAAALISHSISFIWSSLLKEDG